MNIALGSHSLFARRFSFVVLVMASGYAKLNAQQTTLRGQATNESMRPWVTAEIQFTLTANGDGKGNLTVRPPLYGSGVAHALFRRDTLVITTTDAGGGTIVWSGNIRGDSVVGRYVILTKQNAGQEGNWTAVRTGGPPLLNGSGQVGAQNANKAESVQSLLDDSLRLAFRSNDLDAAIILYSRLKDRHRDWVERGMGQAWQRRAEVAADSVEARIMKSLALTHFVKAHLRGDPLAERAVRDLVDHRSTLLTKQSLFRVLEDVDRELGLPQATRDSLRSRLRALTLPPANTSRAQVRAILETASLSCARASHAIGELAQAVNVNGATLRAAFLTLDTLPSNVATGEIGFRCSTATPSQNSVCAEWLSAYERDYVDIRGRRILTTRCVRWKDSPPSRAYVVSPSSPEYRSAILVAGLLVALRNNPTATLASVSGDRWLEQAILLREVSGELFMDWLLTRIRGLGVAGEFEKDDFLRGSEAGVWIDEVRFVLQQQIPEVQRNAIAIVFAPKCESLAASSASRQPFPYQHPLARVLVYARYGEEEPHRQYETNRRATIELCDELVLRSRRILAAFQPQEIVLQARAKEVISHTINALARMNPINF